MTLSRRSILQRGMVTALVTCAPQLSYGHKYDRKGNTHYHPHVSSHTPVHFPAGPEHAFLEYDSKRFANMKGCPIVIQHGKLYEHQDLQLAQTFYEDVPFFVHPSNPVSSLSREQTKNILFGKTKKWSELG